MTVVLSEPLTEELLDQILRIPSVRDLSPSAARLRRLGPTAAAFEVVLEEGADAAETAYLIEDLRGVREVRE